MAKSDNFTNSPVGGFNNSVIVKGDKKMNNQDCQLKSQHRFLDFLYWIMVASLPFITACLAIGSISIGWLIFYFILCILLVTAIFRYFCTHCPHYTQNGKTLKCMFFWWMPKFFKAQPGPLTKIDKTVSILSPVIIAFLPIYWLLLQPAFLIIYILSLSVLATTMKRYECSRCVYSQCPSNTAEKESNKN